MIQFRAEIAPHRNAMPRPPPGSEGQTYHVQPAQHGGRAYPEAEHQAHPNKHLNRPDHVSQKNRVRENQVGEERLVETYCGVGIALQVLLKAAVSKSGSEKLVLSEKEEEECGGDANYSQSLGKCTGLFRHAALILLGRPPRRGKRRRRHRSVEPPATPPGSALAAGAIARNVLL
jgi:hypothetical protein